MENNLQTYSQTNLFLKENKKQKNPAFAGFSLIFFYERR